MGGGGGKLFIVLNSISVGLHLILEVLFKLTNVTPNRLKIGLPQTTWRRGYKSVPNIKQWGYYFLCP